MLTYSTLAASADPWTHYDAKGKGKGHPIIPEPSSFWIVGLCLLFVLLARIDRKGRR